MNTTTLPARRPIVTFPKPAPRPMRSARRPSLDRPRP